jgi:chromosome segregation ATPase
MTWGEAIIASLALLGAWSGLLIGIIKWFLANYHKGLSEKFQVVSEQITTSSHDSAKRNEITNKAIATQQEELRRVDREILNLRVELSEKYVRREDAIREQVVINAKLDALAAKLDNIVLRGGKNG